MAARILIIEDNSTNMTLMTYLLEAFGYGDVRGAADGEEGWQVAQQQPFDLIVCDVHLPKRDGYEVVRLLKEEPSLRATPVLAVTAMAMVGDREKMLEAGFDGYIGKPLDPATFVSQVEQFLPAGLRPERAVTTQVADGSSGGAPPLPSKGIRILVVDDSPVNRELIRSTLVPFGYDLLLAESVEQGWQRAQDEPFDLILCDLHMPNEDGFSFIRRLRCDPRFSSIPFMFLTASSGCDSDPEQAMSLGAARFLRRPIEPQALVDQIEACLHEHDEGGR